MKQVFKVIIWVLLIGCSKESPKNFSEEALSDIFVNIENEELTFEDVLNSNKGKTIFIDVWASWCKDCLKSIPDVKVLQDKYPDVVFLFLSLDKKKENWKNGINRLNLKGEHYYITSGWNGAFGDFVDLSWIPRYMIIDEHQNIKMFKAIKTDDKKIKIALQ